jgi:hypothetical protein
MIINRHNYEECFILYWDNELIASQKQAVENFVKENSDLKEEFKLLGETRFTPDNNVQLEEKEFLLNSSFINITNYEEQLLNYIDDELKNNERKGVEKFVASHPGIQKEFLLLQKTKLQPEAEMVFPDKSVLYRREEKVRVIKMTWFRVAVAAAIILIAGFVTIKFVNTNRSGDKGSVVKISDTKNSNLPIDSSANQTPNGRPTDNVKIKEGDAPVQPTIEKKIQKPVIENRIDNVVASHQAENKNNLPTERKRFNQTLNEQNKNNETLIASVDKPNNNKAEKTESNKTTPNVTLQPGYALNIQEPNERQMVLGNQKDNGGLKEFLRKTTRVFERRTKIQTTTDDNKLLLGAFAVSLK